MTRTMPPRRRATRGPLVAVAALAMASQPTRAADLPFHRGPVPLVAPVLVTPLPGVAAFLPPVGQACAPGYAVDVDGLCKRTDHVAVACGGYPATCRPLSPDPLPYGIGPALRPNY